MRKTVIVFGAEVGRVRLASLAILSAALIWLIVTRSLAAALASSNPELALWLQPSEPKALLALAKAELNGAVSMAPEPAQPDAPDGSGQEPPDRVSGLSRLAEIALLARNQTAQSGAEKPVEGSMAAPSPAPASPEQAKRIHDLVARALSAAPINADAIGVLGQIAELRGEGNAGEVMRMAARLSVRESYAHYWLLKEARQRDDDEAILRQADTLLRTRPRSLPLVLPELGRLAESRTGAEKLGAVLASDPPWRRSVLARMTGTISDARTPLYLLLALRGSQNPPKREEISGYIDFLISKKFHELAYYTWLQFLPPEKLNSLTPINNPGFETDLSGSSFDWKLRPGKGSAAEIRPLPDRPDGLALYVEFLQGRAEFPGVYQTILLGPGRYTLTGRFKGTLVGQRGLVWQVRCIGKAVAGQTDLLGGDLQQWRTFETIVTVPDEDCRAQQIRLLLDARSASEQFVTGSMWFDDLQLKRSSP